MISDATSAAIAPRCMKSGPHFHRNPDGSLGEMHGPARDVIRAIDQLESLAVVDRDDDPEFPREETT